MPKISLWKPTQGDDYKYIDRVAREFVELSGTGVYVHKYIGPVVPDGDANKSNIEDGAESNESTIGDVLFLENRARKYDPDIYELRGTYTVSDTDFDLSQFGIFLTDDTIFMTFHLNDHVERLGRKLLSGDVLELPHLREYHALNEETPALNRFYVVEDAMPSAEGYGPRWWGHLWRVRAKIMPASTEYQDILDRLPAPGDGVGELESLPPDTDGNGNECCEDTIGDIITGGTDDGINDQIEEEAARDVMYDPLYYKAGHFYVYVDPDTQQHQLIWWKTGDGLPPNGIELEGSGDTFPEGMADGGYWLRTDFVPYPVLFQKRGTRFYRIEADMRRLPWTAASQALDSFIDNDNITTNDDGTEVPERQALSKVIKPQPRNS